MTTSFFKHVVSTDFIVQKSVQSVSLHAHGISSVANLRANDCPAKDEETSGIRIFYITSKSKKENFSMWVTSGSYVSHISELLYGSVGQQV